MKNKEFYSDNNFENLFVSVLAQKTNPCATFLMLPTGNCFTNSVKEILHCLELEIKGEVRSENSNRFILNFYELMLSDFIIKDYDFLLYSKILYTLKTYVEDNKTSKVDKYAFFEYLNKTAIFKYRKKVSLLIKDMYANNDISRNAHIIVDIFINELLAVGNNYLYINFVLNEYINKGFKNFEDFVDFLFRGNNDSYDIWIPISFLSLNDKHLFELKDQKIEKIGNINYCKVYSNNTVDFYYIIKENIVRIESLFNILRFYNNSEVDFLFDEKIIINSKYFNKKFELSFDDITKYRSKNYGKNFLKNTIETLENLKNQLDNKKAYHKILNVISYAEKDKDVLNASSYVDNWISLESLISLGDRKKGFDAVEHIVPKMLSAKFFLDYTFKIMNNCVSNNKFRVERFIKEISDNSFDFNKIKDPFYKMEAKRLGEIFASIEKFKIEFERIETYISNELLRIYVLRNEYVHASNLHAFNSMQHFKLKHILSASIDEFFRNLSNRIDSRESYRDESYYGVVFDVFTEILNKHEIRTTAFKLLTETQKLNKGKVILHTNLETQKIELKTFVFNVLKGNSSLFREYTINE